MTAIKAWLRRAPDFLLLIGASVFLLAQAPLAFGSDLRPFSSDLQMGGPGGQSASGKMYWDGARFRMEFAVGGENQIIIVDYANSVQYAITPDRKTYREMAPGQPAPMRIPRIYAVDPANPCSGEQRTECKRIGAETVNGYATEKWEYNDIDGERITAWIATELGFPIKMVFEDESTTDYSNVVVAAQAAGLFEMPSGYEKQDLDGSASVAGSDAQAEIKRMLAGMQAAAATAAAESRATAPPPGSVWEAGDGWVMKLTVTTTAEKQIPSEGRRWTFAAKYSASIPLNLVQPGVPGVLGPTWLHFPSPGIGSPRAEAEPATYAVDWSHEDIVDINTGCGGEAVANATTTTITRGKIEAVASISRPSPRLSVMGGMRLGAGLDSYAIVMSQIKGPPGDQITTKTVVDHCEGDRTTTETETVKREVNMPQFEITDIVPVPPKPAPLQGSKVVPWGFSTSGTFGLDDLSATVEWTITPLAGG